MDPVRHLSENLPGKKIKESLSLRILHYQLIVKSVTLSHPVNTPPTPHPALHSLLLLRRNFGAQNAFRLLRTMSERVRKVAFGEYPQAVFKFYKQHQRGNFQRIKLACTPPSNIGNS